MKPSQKIEMILDWADENDWFDTTFVEDVKEFLEEKGFVTSAQELALDNIIEGFNI